MSGGAKINSQIKNIQEEIGAPIIPGEIFNPEDELKKISSVKKDGLAYKEREEEFLRHKQRYDYQKQGLAGFAGALRIKIEENPDISEAELENLLGEFAHKYGFSHSKSKQLFGSIKLYVEQHKAIQDVLSRFKVRGKAEINGAALFEAAFWVPPKGRVDVSAGPTTLRLRLHDGRDYREAEKHSTIVSHRHDFQGSSGMGGTIRKTFLLLPPCSVIVENFEALKKAAAKKTKNEEEAGQDALWMSSEIISKEDERSLRRIIEPGSENPDFAFDQMISAAQAATKKEIEVCIDQYFKEIRRVSEFGAKGEILAYFAGIPQTNVDSSKKFIEFLRSAISTEKYYDYFKQFAEVEGARLANWIAIKRKEYIGGLGKDGKVEEFSEQEIAQMVARSSKEVLSEGFETVISRGIDAAEALLGEDFSEKNRRKVKMLLSTIPLAKWQREVTKFLKGEESKELSD